MWFSKQRHLRHKPNTLEDQNTSVQCKWPRISQQMNVQSLCED